MFFYYYHYYKTLMTLLMLLKIQTLNCSKNNKLFQGFQSLTFYFTVTKQILKHNIFFF